MSRMEELVLLLQKYAQAYYTKGQLLISDDEYDRLYDELIELEAKEGIVLPGSPSERVGGPVLEGFSKHTHLRPLYSIDKAQSFGELTDWKERCVKGLMDNDIELISLLKFDGLSIVLTYEGGTLINAATRGDGVNGEEVRAQAVTIKSIPLAIPYKGKIEIRGEVIMTKEAFQKYNQNEPIPLKNLRNGAAGALKNLDPKETAKRGLSAYFYDIGYNELDLTSYKEVLDFIREQGLPCHEMVGVHSSLDELKSLLSQIEDERASYNFDIDGVVISINNLAQREALGYTQKFPRWAIAYKFEALETSTLLMDVEWNVGRTGKVTPSAILEPVDIGGATIKRATLNNLDDILRKDLKIGSKILIRRSNDVIPEVMGVLEHYSNSLEIIPPSNCPSCGHKIERDGAHLFCFNSLSCPPQLIKRIVHFASRAAMNIDGFSEKTAEALYDKLELKSIVELYKLTKDKLLNLEGFKDKKATNLLSAIEASKNTTLPRFIYALGIRNVGEKTAKDLAVNFSSIEGLRNASLEDIIAIKDIGEIVADGVYRFFRDEESQRIVDELMDMGIKFDELPVNTTDDKLLGLKVVVTGSIEGHTRESIKQLLEGMGAIVQSSISAKTDLLLAGENAGSKLDKAKDLGIKIISIEDLENR